LYDIRPGNEAGVFLQPRNLHGANIFTATAAKISQHKNCVKGQNVLPLHTLSSDCSVVYHRQRGNAALR